MPIVLTPGIGFTIAVTYAPQGTLMVAHRAVLRIHSNDPAQPIQDIALFGQLAVGALLVSPLALAFGDSPLAAALPFNVGSTSSFHVNNTGVAALTIPQTERVVAPGSYLVLTVMFRPLNTGTHPARIFITPASGGLMPVTVEITGRGQA